MVDSLAKTAPSFEAFGEEILPILPGFVESVDQCDIFELTPDKFPQIEAIVDLTFAHLISNPQIDSKRITDVVRNWLERAIDKYYVPTGGGSTMEAYEIFAQKWHKITELVLSAIIEDLIDNSRKPAASEKSHLDTAAADIEGQLSMVGAK